MKRTISFLLAALLLLSLAACGGKGTWQAQYDLGMRYLNEGNYQEAVIAFETAIKIDPKRPEAYLGAAEAYRSMGDTDSARKILEKGYAETNDSTLITYEAPQIEELYSEDFTYTYGMGDIGQYTCHVPQIMADTQGAVAINHAIEETCTPFIETAQWTLAGGSIIPSYLSIAWETYQYNNILALVVSLVWEAEETSYNVYLYDIASGQQLTTADLLSVLNVDETAFLNAVRQAAAACFDNLADDMLPTFYDYSDLEELAERREWTLSDENINMGVSAYADASGKLYVSLPIGSINGADSYDYILTLDGIS